MQEEWRRIIFRGIQTNYHVSSYGNISGIRRSQLRPVVDKYGYQIFSLHLPNGVRYSAKIHRCVAEAFIPNPNNLPQVNHKDGIKSHNWVSNLEWVTGSENIKHAYDIGIKVNRQGVDHEWTKHSVEKIRTVCELLTKHISIYEIAAITGIKPADISNIRNGKIWRSVSGDYNLPKGINYKGEPLTKYSPELKEAVQELSLAGYTHREIKNCLDLPNIKKIDYMISDVVNRNKNYNSSF